MASTNSRLEVTLETLFESVDLAEDIASQVAAGTGFDEEDRHRISMSVREGMINAVEYGNRQERSKKIFLTFECADDRLVICVRDEGAGFDLADVPDALATENLLKSSGRGILIMRSFMDEFAVRRSCQGGAEVIMAKRYPASRRSGDAPTSRSDPPPAPSESGPARRRPASRGIGGKSSELQSDRAGDRGRNNCGPERTYHPGRGQREAPGDGS